MTAHQGEIDAANPDVGLTIRVTLPLTTRPPSRPLLAYAIFERWRNVIDRDSGATVVDDADCNRLWPLANNVFRAFARSLHVLGQRKNQPAHRTDPIGRS